LQFGHSTLLPTAPQSESELPDISVRIAAAQGAISLEQVGS
jgi:hypothetical protein